MGIGKWLKAIMDACPPPVAAIPWSDIMAGCTASASTAASIAQSKATAAELNRQSLAWRQIKANDETGGNDGNALQNPL